MIIDVLDLSNMSHALFHTSVVEKTFSGKDVWFDRTDGRTHATVLRPSPSSVVCRLHGMYCG